MPPEIVKLADTILKNPVKVEITPGQPTVDIIEQFVYFVDKGNKSALLIDVFLSIGRLKILLTFSTFIAIFFSILNIHLKLKEF